MKKIFAFLLILMLGSALYACSEPQGQDSKDTQSSETNPDPNVVAVPATLGSVTYLSGSWEILTSSENQVVYRTNSGTIAFAFTSKETSLEEFASTLAADAQFGVAPLEFTEEAEEVEVNNIIGTKRTLTIGDVLGELFEFESGENRYVLLAIYDQPENIAEAHQMVDSMFSSMDIEKV